MTPFVAGLVFGIGGMGLVAGSIATLRHGKRGNARVRMLAKQYETMLASADGSLSMDVLGNPDMISSRMDFRKIEAIEAELMGESDHLLAHKLLKSFFEGDDPWVKARAAKVLHAVDSRAALNELKALVTSDSAFAQVPAIWALGELGTQDALNILIPLVNSQDAKIQHAVIRSLVQMEAKERIPSASLTRVKQLLKELRFKADWIL